MIITRKVLKKKIIEDTLNFKSFVDKVYLGEMTLILDCRIKLYNKIVREGISMEIQLHLNELMKGVIYSDFSEEIFRGKIEGLIK